jgi:ribosome assembly protein YihI (activator of Der GTPase)
MPLDPDRLQKHAADLCEIARALLDRFDEQETVSASDQAVIDLYAVVAAIDGEVEP